MKLRRFLTIPLSIVLLTQPLTAALAQATADAAQPAGAITAPADGELGRALAYGFVPDALWVDLTARVEAGQYAQMLTNVIALVDPSRVAEWETVAKSALKATWSIMREDGMLTLYYAACVLGEGERADPIWTNINQYLNAPWDEMKWSYSLFPNWQESAPFEDLPSRKTEWAHIDAAYHYAYGRSSLISLKPLFDIDHAQATMYVSHYMTCDEAIRSALRFYESIQSVAADVIPTVQTRWELPILKNAAARKDKILASETDIQLSDEFIQGSTYTGTAYYLSNAGDDDHTGLSPNEPWQSLAKLNKVKLRAGDAVTIDNIKMVYSMLGVSCGLNGKKSGTGTLVQNCEIAWCGGNCNGAQPIYPGHKKIKVQSFSGGAILMSGCNHAAVNNYIHDCDSKVFVIVVNDGKWLPVDNLTILCLWARMQPPTKPG